MGMQAYVARQTPQKGDLSTQTGAGGGWTMSSVGNELGEGVEAGNVGLAVAKVGGAVNFTGATQHLCGL